MEIEQRNKLLRDLQAQIGADPRADRKRVRSTEQKYESLVRDYSFVKADYYEKSKKKEISETSSNPGRTQSG